MMLIQGNEVAKPDEIYKMLKTAGFSGKYLIDSKELSVRLLHLLQLPQEVPA
jgi:hypothetical protein